MRGEKGEGNERERMRMGREGRDGEVEGGEERGKRGMGRKLYHLHF